MKSINTIYNSILGDIDNNITNMDDKLQDVNNSYFERLLHIISSAGKLSIKEKGKLRECLRHEIGECKYVEILLPKKIQDKLIVSSSHTLKSEDFTGFSTAIKDYDFRIGSTELLLIRQINDFDKIMKNGILPKDTLEKYDTPRGNAYLGKFGEANICVYHFGDIQELYIYVRFNTCRITMHIHKNKYSINSAKRNLF
jgi:hypothetical protein